MVNQHHNPPTLKVAFWNVNMGESSFRDKKAAFTQWIAENQPDILFLEELSAKLGGGRETIHSLIPAQWPMVQRALVNTLDKNFDQSTKCLSVLVRRDLQVQAGALQLENLHQRRMLIKLVVGGVTMWGLHANASERGGDAATQAAADYLARFRDALIGGDFNYPIGAVPRNLRVVAPISWEENALRFSQWKNNHGGFSGGPEFHLPTMRVEQDVETHGVIDYLAHGGMVRARALPNCQGEANWRNIVAQFDHCPVFYEVQLLQAI